VQALDLGKLSYAQARYLHNCTVRVVATIDTLPDRTDKNRVQYVCVGPENEMRTIELDGDGPQRRIGSTVVVEGRLVRCWFSARVIDGQTFKAVAEVIVVEGRVVKP
jgi:hypothetical protein